MVPLSFSLYGGPGRGPASHPLSQISRLRLTKVMLLEVNAQAWMVSLSGDKSQLYSIAV